MKAKEKITSAKRTPTKKLDPRKKEPKALDLSGIIKNKTEELLQKLGFASSATVSLEENRYLVNLQSNEPNLLIGFHGQTLAALQLIISLAIQKQTSAWTPIILDTADYRERREEQLRHLALSVAQRVRFSGQPQSLSRLSAAERRIVHLSLANDEMVETLSEGEGQDRHLVIRPKIRS